MISNIFRDYRLNINEDKIKINKYPYDIQSNLNQIIYLGRNMNEKGSIIYIINECNRLYSDGIDASYKYVLKSLTKLKKGDLAQWEYLESFFLSVLTIKPDLARYISKIIIPYKNYVTKEFIIRAKKILMYNVESKNECEVLWVLWLLIILGYKNFSRCDLIRLLNLNNDFVRIMVIDFIKDKGISIKSVDFYLSVIENDLANLEINSSNWLILYEAVIKNWFNNPIIKRKVQSNNFFKVLLKNKIDFYRIK